MSQLFQHWLLLSFITIQLITLRKWTNSLEDTNYQSFTQEEIDNKNSPGSVKQIEFIIENLPTKETPDSDGFPGEF